jgi:UDP-GlcNAc:undecaprenyl-phosphate GlcNAc-1-phosphate transferase
MVYNQQLIRYSFKKKGIIMDINYLWGIMVAYLAVTTLVPYVIKFAYKIGAVDVPCERKVHCVPVPRIGGLAIFLGYILSLLMFLPSSELRTGIILASSFIVLLGIIDDLYNISPKQKLLGQFIAAFVLVFYGVKIGFLTNPFGGTFYLGVFSIPFTIFWIVGVTNAVNLIDGLDGLAAGTSAISAVVLAIVAFTQGIDNVGFIALLLAASSAGFLWYNFNPAKIFMGDTGSMLLGLNLAVISVMSVTKSIAVLSIFVPIIILGVPLFDTLFAIIRRYQNNQPIFKADKEHLHHCLLNKGLSHKNTVLLIYLINIILGVSAILLSNLTHNQGMILVTVLSIVIYIGAQNLGVLKEIQVQNVFYKLLKVKK